MADELAVQVEAIGALAEPVRRMLYLYVAEQPAPVSREEAAAAVEVPLHTAKFHLDRLVEQGLLQVSYRRLSGRTGPGAGRPAKLYQRSARQLSVSLPERRYDLAGEVMAVAIDQAVTAGRPIEEAVPAAARERGRTMGASMPEAERDRGSRLRRRRRSTLERTAQVLAEHGYEPRVGHGEIRLANCPFDRLAADHTELVCGLNLALLEGVVDGLGARDQTPVLAPEPGFCCVVVRGG